MTKRASANGIIFETQKADQNKSAWSRKEISMRKLLVGNAPCSWGALEFESVKGETIPFHRMLDELAETGYTGTELGDWGFMPTDASALAAELTRRSLVMLGAFVPVAMKNASSHAAGVATAVKTARLLAAVATTPSPYLVLADDNGTEPERTRMAGRIQAGVGLSVAEWKVFAAGADQIARAVFEETGLRTVFHHHCAGYVETPEEMATLLDLTVSELLGMVFDTGHSCYGAGRESCDVVATLERFKERIWYIHLKDCQPQVAQRARAEGWDYFTALRHGVFCELGKGCVDFPALLRWLGKQDYQGYVTVEQDILPGMGTPKQSARRNREYLQSIEDHFATEAPNLSAISN
jgi:inosose dehydratase